MFIKVYHSFCSDHKIIINGHVLQEEPIQFHENDSWIGSNIKSLLTLFRVKPLENIPLKIHIFNEVFETQTNEDGYFSLSTHPQENIEQGWHEFTVVASDSNQKEITRSLGKFFKPFQTSHGIISDIDDTVLKSYSTTLFRRLYELLTKNPQSRKLFDHTVEWYRELSECSSPGKERHPFFYVSSSEWNLYDYLNSIFKKHQLPKGIFLLNDLKTLRHLFKTGKTGHQGKYHRIKFLLDAYPHQNYILIGDNTQQDPYIYNQITQEFPERIIAVFLRNRAKRKTQKTQKVMKQMKVKNNQILLFNSTIEAFKMSKKWGLIEFETNTYSFLK